ncbi:MAG: alcohol dehydrogenase catalytic domain-containing protein [Pyrinomonadaceae bacterium]
MKLDDVSDLKAAAQQVIVQTKAIGVNPVDVYIRSGSYPLKPPLPYTPGMDAAGVVAEVGAKVTRVRQGERVYVAGTISGAYAEFTLCDQSQVHHLPDQISFEQGAAVGVPYGTAYRALFHRAQSQAG